MAIYNSSESHWSEGDLRVAVPWTGYFLKLSPAMRGPTGQHNFSVCQSVCLSVSQSSLESPVFWSIFDGCPSGQKRQATEHFWCGGLEWCVTTGKRGGIPQRFKVLFEVRQISDVPWKCKNGKCSVARRFLTFFSPKRSTFGVSKSSKRTLNERVWRMVGNFIRKSQGISILFGLCSKDLTKHEVSWNPRSAKTVMF